MAPGILRRVLSLLVVCGIVSIATQSCVGQSTTAAEAQGYDETAEEEIITTNEFGTSELLREACFTTPFPLKVLHGWVSPEQNQGLAELTETGTTFLGEGTLKYVIRAADHIISDLGFDDTVANACIFFAIYIMITRARNLQEIISQHWFVDHFSRRTRWVNALQSDCFWLWDKATTRDGVDFGQILRAAMPSKMTDPDFFLWCGLSQFQSAVVAAEILSRFDSLLKLPADRWFPIELADKANLRHQFLVTTVFSHLATKFCDVASFTVLFQTLRIGRLKTGDPSYKPSFALRSLYPKTHGQGGVFDPLWAQATISCFMRTISQSTQNLNENVLNWFVEAALRDFTRAWSESENAATGVEATKIDCKTLCARIATDWGGIPLATPDAQNWFRGLLGELDCVENVWTPSQEEQDAIFVPGGSSPAMHLPVNPPVLDATNLPAMARRIQQCAVSRQFAKVLYQDRPGRHAALVHNAFNAFMACGLGAAVDPGTPVASDEAPFFTRILLHSREQFVKDIFSSSPACVVALGNVGHTVAALEYFTGMDPSKISAMIMDYEIPTGVNDEPDVDLAALSMFILRHDSLITTREWTTKIFLWGGHAPGQIPPDTPVNKVGYRLARNDAFLVSYLERIILQNGRHVHWFLREFTRIGNAPDCTDDTRKVQFVQEFVCNNNTPDSTDIQKFERDYEFITKNPGVTGRPTEGSHMPSEDDRFVIQQLLNTIGDTDTTPLRSAQVTLALRAQSMYRMHILHYPNYDGRHLKLGCSWCHREARVRPKKVEAALAQKNDNLKTAGVKDKGKVDPPTKVKSPVVAAATGVNQKKDGKLKTAGVEDKGKVDPPTNVTPTKVKSPVVAAAIGCHARLESVLVNQKKDDKLKMANVNTKNRRRDKNKANAQDKKVAKKARHK